MTLQPRNLAGRMLLALCMLCNASGAFADPILMRGGEDLSGATVRLAPAAPIAVPSAAPHSLQGHVGSNNFPPVAPGHHFYNQTGRYDRSTGYGQPVSAPGGAAPYSGSAAQSGYYNQPMTNVPREEHRTYFQEHPQVRAALKGA